MSRLAHNLCLLSLKSQLTFKGFLKRNPHPQLPALWLWPHPEVFTLEGNILLGFGWLLHSSSSWWLLWARNRQSPGVWLYPAPGHRFLSFRVIWWVRLLGVWLNPHSLMCMAVLEHHVTQCNQRRKRKPSHEERTHLSGFLTTPTQWHVS